METRSLTVQDVTNAIKIIRDSVITDTNITLVEDIIAKMQTFLIDIYMWLSSSPQAEEQLISIAEESGEGNSTRIILHVLKNEPSFKEMNLSIRSRKISIGGMIDAIKFIREHLKNAGEMLTSLMTLLEAFSTIQSFKKQLTGISEDTRTIPSFDSQIDANIYAIL
jgi:hypothetical protein